MTDPRVSVIVPALDEAAAIADLLHDLRRACDDDDELIVVDGGSSDATAAVAAPLADRVIRAPCGRASQMNAGAALAAGDVLWFVHADTRVPVDAREPLARLAQTEKCWGRFDVRLSGRRRSLRVIERTMNLRSRITGIATGDQGIFVARAAFERVGGFPEIPLMEDIALSRALLALSRPLCPRSPLLQTSSRRWETRGVARTVLLMWRLRLAYALGASPDSLARQYR